MIRGTTPTLVFTLPFAVDNLAAAWITIAQNKNIIIDKALGDCVCDGNTLSVALSQSETLQLTNGVFCEVQIRVRTVAGEALASKIYTMPAERILKDGVI